jgi:hypothetical protein
MLVGNIERKTKKNVDKTIILKRILNKHYGRLWTGIIFFRIGTSGRLL